MHSVMAILFIIINLSPDIRMTLPAVQVATLVNDSDCKAVGMTEIINGGTTSIGAQLRELQNPALFTVLSQDGRVHEDRFLSFHAVAATGDFPAMASLLPFKSSVAAHRFDRHSNVDQRSKHYQKANSFLRPDTEGVPHFFERRTYASIKQDIFSISRPPTNL